MKYIKLGGKYGGNALVDDDDFERLVQFSYSNTIHGYAQRAYMFPNGKRGIAKMHRDVLSILPGDPRHIDHVNGNKLDNTRSNLRICTQRQNSSNRPSSKNNTSGYKGVSIHNQSGRWRAYIKVNYKQIPLGCYDTREKAAAAYNYAAIDHYGEFARLNTLPDGVSFTRKYLASERAAYDTYRKSPEYRELIRQRTTQRWQERKAEGHRYL